MDMLICSIEEQRYAFELAKIKHCFFSVAITPQHNVENFLGVLNFHGEILPVFNLRKYLGLPEKEIGIDDRFIICGNEKLRLVVIVDSIHDLFSCNEKNCLKNDRHMLEKDGHLIPIIPIDKLLQNVKL